MNLRVSVIVPVYGVEGFVERCVRSLMEQTLVDGVEFIFVDDAAKDKSFDILVRTIKDYPLRQQQIKLLRHKDNKGLPAARNTGLSAASGEYICHFDADDFAEKDLLEKFWNTAANTGADYIWADWFLTYRHNSRLMKQASYSTPRQTLCALLMGQIKYNVWNKMVRRSLYTRNNIRFPEGHNMGEDMTMIRLAACASSVAHIDYAGYHYVKTNTSAMTATFSFQSLCDIQHNVAETLSFLQADTDASRLMPSDKHRASSGNRDLPPAVRGLSPEDLKRLGAAFCLHTKFPLLMSSCSRDYKQWALLWPQSNRYAACAGLSRTNILLNAFASKGWWFWVRLHYYAHSLCYRLFYH